MLSTPLYNSIIIKSYIDYLNHTYPDLNIKNVLNYSNIANYELEDLGHWLTQEQVNRFQEYVQKITGNPNIAREAGRYIASPKSSSHLRQYVAGFLSPAMVYWALEKVGTTISRHETIKSKKLGDNKIEITATPRENVKEELFQCENRFGMFEAVSEVFTNKFAHIEHPECIHKGGKCCRYIITWDESPSFIWKRIGIYLITIILIASIPIAFLAHFTHWLIFFLSGLMVSTGIILRGNILNIQEMRKLIEGQGEASNELFAQINLRYNESSLIKEIGEAISNILDHYQLLDRIVMTLEKRLKFNRGMIMLVNSDKTKLVYNAGYGFSQKEEALLRSTDFNLTNPDSKGIFYLAYRDLTPFLITNANDLENRLSEKSARFMRQLNVKAFICVPIIYEGKTEGIMAVDNSKSKDQPTQSDLSLLMGIARQIGISLNNALAHKKLKESEERFRNLSDNSPDVIYQLNIEGQLTYINPAGKHLLGQQGEQIIGSKFVDFVTEDLQEEISGVLEKIILTKSTIRDQKLVLINNKGNKRQVLFTGAPDLDTEGNVIGILGTMKDVTKYRAMETQLQQASKMEALGTLTGGIAHDFNNIIQAIMGYTQLMLMEKKENESDTVYLNNIEKLTQRSIDMVRQLLLFSKKVDPQIKVMNLNDEVRNMNKLLAKSIPKMIEINMDLSEDVSFINADSVQIGQIIMNLLINARDAIGETGNIFVRTQNITLTEDMELKGFIVPSGNYVRMSVSDNGCGMDKYVTERIFEPFFTTKEIGKGTGLGLSVVYGIVRNHNGFIYCESTPGKGTTFHVLLPASANIKERDADAVPRMFLPGTETILFVDDEISILEIGKDMLRLRGYDVIVAKSGEEAVDIYRKQKDNIHLVVLDLIMPGQGGKKCLYDLISVNPQVKVIMTSGFISFRQEEELAKEGAAAFLRKPYHPDDLLSSIREILDSKNHPAKGFTPLHNSIGV